MALDFTGNSQTLLARLGRCGAVVNNLTANQATQKVALGTDLTGQLAADPDVQAIVGQAYLSALSSLGGGLGSLMTTTAQAVVSRAVFNDNPRLGQTLTDVALLGSLQEIIRQMKAQGQTVLAQAITATVGNFTGNAVLNVSTRRPFDGAVLENTLAETLNCQVTNDSYAGSATAGNETITANGAGAVGDPFAWNWPGGSNSSNAVNLIDGSKDNTSGNELVNSGWDAFVANVPSNWAVVTGVAGTDFLANTGVTYDGVSSLQIVGNGAANVRLRQQFNSTSGTTTSLSDLSQHSFCGWLLRDGVAPGAGTLRIALTDAAGTVIKDAAGADNSLVIDLTALTTTWTPYKATFRLPLILPSAIYLDVAVTAGLTAGRSVFLDRFGMGPMTQLYTSGPFLAGHSGSVPLTIGDLAQVLVGNGRGAAGTLNTWQTVFSRLFFGEVFNNELLLPSAAVPTVSDALLA